MKKTKRILLLFSVILLFACEKEESLLDNNFEQTISSKKGGNTKSYMVISKSENLSDDLEISLAEYGTVVNTIPEIGVLVVSSNDSNFTNNVSNLANVRSVVPDLKVNWRTPSDVSLEVNPPSIGDNEFFFAQGLLWGLDDIDAPEAWNAGYTGSGVTIAILDEGIDRNHGDLSPNLNTSTSASFVPGETWYVREGVGSFFNHGSHVAGIAAGADSDFGIIGVAPNAEIMAVKVLSEFTGTGAFSWINAGIVHAANNGADVINMSLGATLNKNGKFYDDDGNLVAKIPSKFIQEVVHAQQRAVNYAYRMGATIITSAGNSQILGDGNRSEIVMPADLNNVVTVSATGKEDTIASYSNIGRSLIDVAAPGGDFAFSFSITDVILSAGGGGSFWWAQGTSMAAPHVAGVAALIIEKNGGDMDPHEVEKQLINSSVKIDTNGNSIYYGKGRVSAYNAIK